MSNTLTRQGTRPAVLCPAYALMSLPSNAIQSVLDNRIKFDGRHEWATTRTDSLT